MPAEAVHLVYALDLSLLAPAFVVSGVLLWRRTPWGLLLGGAVSVFGAAYLTVLWCVGGFQADAGIDGKTWLSPAGVVPALLCLACALLLLRRSGPRPPSTAPTRTEPSRTEPTRAEPSRTEPTRTRPVS
jgi:hypothetical protein